MSQKEWVYSENWLQYMLASQLCVFDDRADLK